MKPVIKAIAAAGGIIIAAKGLDSRLESTRYAVKSRLIPKDFDGFKIVQISDIHSDIVPNLVPKIRAEKPDIIVSTGDLVHHTGDFYRSAALCRRLSKIAPVYAVTGNHDVWRGDYCDFENALNSAGVKTLHNERLKLTRGDSHIYLSGIDDPFAVTNKRIKSCLNRSVYGLDKAADSYNILLFHRANWLNFFADRNFDLILSGHMHGGQMRIPPIGGVAAPRSSWASSKTFFPKYTGGLYRLNHTAAIVSRGLGNPMLLPRIFNRPELVTVTLKHKKTN